MCAILIYTGGQWWQEQNKVWTAFWSRQSFSHGHTGTGIWLFIQKTLKRASISGKNRCEAVCIRHAVPAWRPNPLPHPKCRQGGVVYALLCINGNWHHPKWTSEAYTGLQWMKLRRIAIPNPWFVPNSDNIRFWRLCRKRKSNFRAQQGLCSTYSVSGAVSPCCHQKISCAFP